MWNPKHETQVTKYPEFFQKIFVNIVIRANQHLTRIYKVPNIKDIIITYWVGTRCKPLLHTLSFPLLNQTYCALDTTES
jgi:hypothetical protein